MRHGNMLLIRPCKFWNFIVKKKTVSFDSFYGYYVLILFFETYTILKCEMISFQPVINLSGNSTVWRKGGLSAAREHAVNPSLQILEFYCEKKNSKF